LLSYYSGLFYVVPLLLGLDAVTGHHGLQYALWLSDEPLPAVPAQNSEESKAV